MVTVQILLSQTDRKGCYHSGIFKTVYSIRFLHPNTTQAGASALIPLDFWQFFLRFKYPPALATIYIFYFCTCIIWRDALFMYYEIFFRRLVNMFFSEQLFQIVT